MNTPDPLNMPGDILAPRTVVSGNAGRVGVLGNGDRLFVTRADQTGVVVYPMGPVPEVTDPITPETLGDLQGFRGGEFVDFAGVMTHIETEGQAVTARRLAAIQKRYDVATEKMLNQRADAWGYASLSRATTYAASTNAQWAAEAAALIAHRDEVWIAAYTILQAVLNGQRSVPALADYLAELPAAPVRPTV